MRKLVLRWGSKNYRPFPWREIENPWLALLAEVLLQRTNARQVQQYYDEVCSRFPTPESVIRASREDLEILESRFGLDRRIRTVRNLAEYIEAKEFYPLDEGELSSQFGIGHYTAAAYLSLHMNVRAVLVDSNVARWLARMTGNDKPVDVRRCPWLWQLADQLTPAHRFRDYNYAVLDLTMTVCKVRMPDCGSCPLSRYCVYARGIRPGTV